MGHVLDNARETEARLRTSLDEARAAIVDIDVQHVNATITLAVNASSRPCTIDYMFIDCRL